MEVYKTGKRVAGAHERTGKRGRRVKRGQPRRMQGEDVLHFNVVDDDGVVAVEGDAFGQIGDEGL